MKKMFAVMFSFVFILLLFSSCGNSTVITERDTEESFSNPVFDLSSDSETIAVEDGNNYILLTMNGGSVAKAEYAFQFGTNEAAKSMYDYYEEKGYDPQYSGGYLNGIYLVMTYADTSKYIDMTEAEIQSQFGDKITTGYFEDASEIESF